MDVDHPRKVLVGNWKLEIGGLLIILCLLCLAFQGCMFKGPWFTKGYIHEGTSSWR